MKRRTLDPACEATEQINQLKKEGAECREKLGQREQDWNRKRLEGLGLKVLGLGLWTSSNISLGCCGSTTLYTSESSFQLFA